jgi:hypothetical protein
MRTHRKLFFHWLIISTTGFFIICGLGGCNGDGSKSNSGSSQTGNGIYILHGINFGPYKGAQDPNAGSQVTMQQIREDLEVISGHTDWIRTFGSTQGLEEVARIAQTEFGLGTAIGAWLSKDETANQKEMDNLIAAAKDGYVDLAVVGSEVLLRGDLAAEELIAYIEQFRSAVPDIPVTTADVYYNLWNNEDVMDACDVIFFNYHPYWEGRDVEKAVAYLHSVFMSMESLLAGNRLSFRKQAGPAVVLPMSWQNLRQRTPRTIFSISYPGPGPNKFRIFISKPRRTLESRVRRGSG